MKQFKTPKYVEGNVIAVPLEDGSFSIGVVIRVYRSKWAATTYVGFVSSLNCTNEILRVVDNPTIRETFVTGRLGLFDGSWTQLFPLPNYNRDDWPIPLMKIIDGTEFRLVQVDETLINSTIVPEVPKNWETYKSPGLTGHQAVERTLYRMKLGEPRPNFEEMALERIRSMTGDLDR